MIRLRRLGCLLLALACTSTSLAQPAFESLPPAKAVAASPERPEIVRAVVHSQPSELAASVRAQEQCQAQAAAGEVCELVRLNDRRITTGAEILAAVPDESHPLFLWRFQRGATVVYLAGSIHILKPSLYPLPAPLEQAFDSADYLVLEVNVEALSQDEIRTRTRAHAELPAGQTLADVLPEPLYQRLNRHLAAFGMNATMLSRAKPAMVMNHVVVSRLLALGYLPDSGLENHFLRQRTDQQTLELESLETQLGLLFDQPMATQVQLLAETLEVESEIEPMLADMLVAWLSGDDAGFLELFKAQSGDSAASQAFLRELLDERNVEMADTVKGYLQTAPGDAPRTYFVLVGAAHLVGERGIVELLADEGIEGRRVMSTDRVRDLAEPVPP